MTTWIRNRGWDAFANTGPMAGTMVMIPPAIECGFGELGKHGSIINKEYGSSFRLSCVLTNVPLVPTPRQSYGVDDFCSRCQVLPMLVHPRLLVPKRSRFEGRKNGMWTSTNASRFLTKITVALYVFQSAHGVFPVEARELWNNSFDERIN